MSTVLQQSMTNAFCQAVTDEPEAGAVYSQYLVGMLGARFGWQHIFGQQPMQVDVIDAMAFSKLHVWLCTGQLLAAKIHVGNHPTADAAEVQNNVKLAHLPEPFTAHFFSGAGDNDGYVKWSKPIDVDIVLNQTGQHITETLEPASAPMEVGYTKFETTVFHLGAEGKLARWPYGDEYITLLYLRKGATP